MDGQIGAAVAVLLAEGGVPAALLMGAWIVARALAPFAERFVESWERFLTGLQGDIAVMARALESVGVALRESAIQQAAILHGIEVVDGKVSATGVDVARIVEILRGSNGNHKGQEGTKDTKNGSG